jgi:RNA polymerase sigma factor (TIGR02999 family)
MTESTPSTKPSHTSAEGLFPDVYDQLRSLAGAQLAHESSDHTLSPTALVHEVYLRLSGRGWGWNDRSHFLRVAAQAMRHILISHARTKNSLKRGGDRVRVELDGLDFASPPDCTTLLALDAALSALAAEDPGAAAVVELRYFGGADWDAIAASVHLSVEDARQEWAFAKAWLLRYLRSAGTNRHRP